ncbi:MAE_28990/MAE_18760 family HEPN-like nuclease [Phormidesmis priestleyi]|uniref:MAE_28990/MAE_18760 family HEPN-like nuclease n=1 Tax=Phormidesmis priestleyi TaxID=268141 RepID=UPI00083A0084|nr:MAE_28990/MAE_18760 family HEPN-like nuclease [Phormidesmis priestleyi]
MTSVLIQDFTERSKEVSKYFIFLKSLEQGTTKLSMNGKGNNSKIKEIDPELLKTLKASGFLLLYNLVEATMRNIIEAIFDQLRSEGISYDEIRPELKKVVLKNLKKRNPDEVFSSIAAISVDIITAGFDKKDLFSGNLDGKKIRETAAEYGFSHLTDHTKTGNGSDLLTVKANRNDLAHGIKSFAEIGRDKTADELLEIRNKVIRYLKQILKNIETYLDNKDYLDASVVRTS